MAPGSFEWVNQVSRSLREHEKARGERGASFPRYEILEEVGRGGMGIVYRAWDPELGRHVAIKVLLEHAGGGGAEARERFLREAQLAARLYHPNIIPVYETGESNGQAYLAMPFIEGTTAEKAKLDLRRTLEVVRDAARGLDYAHRQGVVHRDVKPSNILIDGEGRVYVTDFGLARATNVSAKLTLSGTILGTPSYMSPEQARGEAAQPRSDVYALGASLYDLLTGRPPFAGTDPMVVLNQVIYDEPAPPRRRKPDIPRDVETILLKAMEKESDRRYATAGELADDLQRFLDRQPIRATRQGLLYRLGREVARRPWKAVAALSLLFALGVGGAAGKGYLDARELYLRAESEPDDAKKRELLLRVVWWYPSARDQIRDIEDRMRQPLDRQRKQIGDKSKECRKHLLDRQAAFARASLRSLEEMTVLDELRATRDEEVGQLVPEVLALEFETDLEALAALPAPEGFPALFARLSGEAFAGVKDRQDRLTAALLALGRRLVEKNLGAARGYLAGLKELKLDDLAGRLQPLLREGELKEGLAELRALGAGNLVGFDRRYRELAAAFPDRKGPFGEVAREVGLALANRGAGAEALRWLTAAEELGAGDAKLFEARGVAALEAGDDECAELDFDEFTARRAPGTPTPPRFARVLCLKAERSMERENWGRALELLDQALWLDRDEALTYHHYGRARYRAHGLFEDALKDLQQALDRKLPFPPHADYGLAIRGFARAQAEKFWKRDSAKERQDAWKAALKWLDLAIDRLGLDSPELRRERAAMRRRGGDYERALEDAARAGEDADALVLRGQVRYLNARGADPSGLREALADFERAAALRPTNAEILYGRAVCLLSLGRAEEARQDLLEAVRLQPFLPYAHSWLASLSFRDSRDASKDHATKALSSADHLGESEYALRFAEAQRASRAEVIRLLKRDALYLRSRAFFDQRSFKECEKDMTDCILLDNGFPRADLLRGMARHELGLCRDAIADFDRTIQLSKEGETKEDQLRAEDAAKLKRRCEEDIRK